MPLAHQSLFTGTNGDGVTTLTPSIGNPLTVLGGTGPLVQDNRAYPGADYSSMITGDTFGTANYVVRGIMRRIADTGNAQERTALFARCSAGGNDYYLADFGKTSVRLFVRVGGGSESQIGSTYTWSPSIGVDYKGELIVEGSSIVVRVDDTVVIGPVTNTSVTATNQAAFDFFQQAGGSYAAKGWHLTTFEVDTTLPSTTTPTRTPNLAPMGIHGL